MREGQRGSALLLTYQSTLNTRHGDRDKGPIDWRLASVRSISIQSDKAMTCPLWKCNVGPTIRDDWALNWIWFVEDLLSYWWFANTESIRYTICLDAISSFVRPYKPEVFFFSVSSEFPTALEMTFPCVIPLFLWMYICLVSGHRRNDIFRYTDRKIVEF